MPTLRQMIDGQLLGASEAATHVAKHVQDPFASTKDDMDDLNTSLMDYNTKRQQMKMKLAPVENVVDGIKNMHQLEPEPQIDPMTGMPMQNPDQQNAMGDPPQMSQTTGQMNSNRPSLAGFQPGVSPGPAQSVVPGKMGMPTPGQGSPSAVAGAPGAQFNPSAPKPPGAGQLPGAKGPGDPKVGNQVKKAQSNSGGGSGKKGGSGASSSSGKVNIQVHANNNLSPASQTMSKHVGMETLRSCYGKMSEKEAMEAAKISSNKRKAKMKAKWALKDEDMEAYGTSEGVTKEWDTRGRSGHAKDPGAVEQPISRKPSTDTRRETSSHAKDPGGPEPRILKPKGESAWPNSWPPKAADKAMPQSKSEDKPNPKKSWNINDTF